MQNEKENKSRTVSAAFTESQHQDLLDLVEFFQEQTPATITKSDVIIFLITKTNEIRKQRGEAANEYFEGLGVSMNFKIGKTDNN